MQEVDLASLSCVLFRKSVVILKVRAEVTEEIDIYCKWKKHRTYQPYLKYCSAHHKQVHTEGDK
jgi:hypothetical protein